MPEDNTRWRAVNACRELSYWNEYAGESLAEFKKELSRPAPYSEHLTHVKRAVDDLEKAAATLKREIVRLRGRGLVKKE